MSLTTKQLQALQEAQARGLDINPQTGEILVEGSLQDIESIKATKIKALSLLSPNDFVKINGIWEAKRDGLIKILSSLPISYEWKIKQSDVTDSYSQILGVLTVTNGSIQRSADSMGICEFSELKGNGGMHFMNTRAETRALKRAIETIFGSVINWYVLNHLEGRRVA